MTHPKRYLLDFEVESHGCLLDECGPIETSLPSEGVEIRISNLSINPGTDRPLLSFHLIHPGDDLESTSRAGRAFLKRYLNYLSFATNLTFRIHKLYRIVDWTPGLTERECYQYQAFPGSELPYPVLDKPLFESVERLFAVETTPAFQRALKWFSAGVRAEYMDDQFQYFWLVVELVAQLNKAPEKVNDSCPICRSPLYCQACDSFPTHRPYPKQSIYQLFDKMIEIDAEKIFKTANDVRNAIMHGDDVESIEASQGIKFEDVVNQVGGIAWAALLNAFTHNPDDRKRIGSLSILQTNMHVHQLLTMKVHMLVYSSDPQNPKVSELPNPKIEMRFKDDQSAT